MFWKEWAKWKGIKSQHEHLDIASYYCMRHFFLFGEERNKRAL